MTPSNQSQPGVGAPLDERVDFSSSASPLFWRQLTSLMKDGRVIPIIGQDLIQIEDEGRRCTLNVYIARRVQTMLGLPPDDRTASPTLHQVACRYLEVAGDRKIGDIYWAVREAFRKPPVPVPEALRKLARIEAFSLFVTTTFDDLLQRAVDAERFNGVPRTQTLAYAPGREEDLPAPLSRLTTPVVYHLLGRLSAAQDFVVTEEDTLEFVHSLQSENRRPNLLLDELRSHTLLLIGSGYSDWLMRFFLRMGKRDRLLLARSKTDIVVDPKVRDDDSLADFLRHFSGQTEVITCGAVEFIDELSARWEDERDTAEEPVGALALSHEGEAIPEDSIFVSYASEDRELAQRLVAALRAARLPVWFDKSGDQRGLQGGENYQLMIQSRIQSASLFVPVLSRSVLTPQKRFFKLEWDEAVQASRRAGENQSFIVPVRVDDVPPDSPTIPPRFRQLHWMDAQSPADYAAVVARIRDLYREYQHALRASA